MCAHARVCMPMSLRAYLLRVVMITCARPSSRYLELQLAAEILQQIHATNTNTTQTMYLLRMYVCALVYLSNGYVPAHVYLSFGYVPASGA
jgi:hypothetical protein